MPRSVSGPLAAALCAGAALAVGATPALAERELWRAPPSLTGKKKPRVAVLFGTFDPVHEGHVDLTRRATGELGFDQVLVVPNGQPAHKPNATALEHRLAMLRARLRSEAGTNLYQADPTPFAGDRGSFVRRVKALYGTDDVSFLLGGDAFSEEIDLGLIHEGTGASYVVFERGETMDLSRLSERLRRRVRVVPDADSGMSSSKIRSAVKEGHRISRRSLHPRVLRYIRRHGLYRAKSVRSRLAGPGSGGGRRAREVWLPRRGAGNESAERGRPHRSARR